MNCPICISTNISENYLQFNHGSIHYVLERCLNCSCLFYLNDVSFDFKNNFEHNRNLKIYLEKTADAEGLITIVYNLFTSNPQHFNKGLEIGCGVGLIIDFAERELKKSITGFEPSLHYSNEARELLKLNIIQDFFTAETAAGIKADFAFCFQVLQMVDEPKTMLLDIKNSLNSNGILLLSTPDNETIIHGGNLAENFSILSPGVHKIIFNEKSLQKVLNDAGFPFVQVYKSHNQYFAVASFEKLPPVDLLAPNRNVVLEYYKNRLAELPESSSYFKGIWYRYFRNRIDNGEYAEALDLLQQTKWFEVWTEEEINHIPNNDKLFELNSFADAIVYYYTGILFLNYLHQPRYAEKFFRLSFLLSKKMIQVQPGMCAIEEDIIWLAKLHVIISKINYGVINEGKEEIINFLAINHLNDKILPKVPNHLLIRAESLLKSIS